MYVVNSIHQAIVASQYQFRGSADYAQGWQFMLLSSYNSTFVTFSLIVAILASYTALNMASRVSGSTGKASALWLIGGSFAMGFGIWSMHFIGMLAFNLPISLGYDVPLTILSLLIAIAYRPLPSGWFARRICLGPAWVWVAC
jgi:NO-binding membrane sensor protein with MHYT domain